MSLLLDDRSLQVVHVLQMFNVMSVEVFVCN